VNYQETTQVANAVFDTYMPRLKPSEVLVLLTIIRQTIGWYNHKTKKRKYQDWISNKQFQKKTGLSNKTISKALHTLIALKLIEATNKQGEVLNTPGKRKGTVRTFYRCLLYTKVKSSQESMYKVHITKLTDTKLREAMPPKDVIGRLSDAQRYEQIMIQNKSP